MAHDIERIKFSQMANFSPKQKQAMRALKTKKFVLYGGAAGGGKSYWLRWALLKLLMQYYKQTGKHGIRVGLFCEDYPSLKDRQLSKIEYEFPDWLGQMEWTDKVFKLRPEYGSGAICFRNLDNPSKYASSEFAAIGIDEITRNAYSVFTYLRMRLRWVGIDNPKFLCASNPDGIGHTWVKKIWLDHKFEEKEKEQDAFHFIPAMAFDNPYLSPEYVNSLEGLPENLRRAYLNGDWDVFEGQFFSEWDRNIHITKPYAIPDNWERYLCCDYGWTAPCAVYWVAVNGDGQRIHYRELYVTKHNPTMLAKKIVAMTPPHEMQTLKNMYCDPSMWTSKAGEDTCANLIQKTFNDAKYYVKLVPAETARNTRALKMREELMPYENFDGSKTAKFLMFEGACPNLARTIPALVFSKTNPEDVDTKGEDHAYDAATYGQTYNSSSKINMRDVRKVNDNVRKLEAVGSYW